MATFTIDIDAGDLDAAAAQMAASMGKLNMLTAIAMTKGVVAARNDIRDKIFPMIEGGPSRWTQRGLIFTKATPTDLRAQAGFNYGGGRFEDDYTTRKGGGVPSGRYMRTLARGGDRPAKSSELQAWRSGALRRNDQYLMPNKKLKEIDQHGNLPGGQWQSALAGIGAFHAPGSGQNVRKGKGKGKRGPKYKYFLMLKSDLGGYTNVGKQGERFRGDETPWAIVRRVGYNNRGFEPVLFVTQAQNYERMFPIDRVAMTAFNRTFPTTFQELVKEAWERKRAKKTN